MSYISYIHIYWYYASDVVYFLGILFWHTTTHAHAHTHSYTHVCALFAGIKIRDITLRVAHVSHTKLYLTLPLPLPLLAPSLRTFK